MAEAIKRLSFDFVGCRFGDFQVLEEIGRGGVGVVYLAEEVSTQRRVALKVLTPQFCHTVHRAARFRREALTESRLSHPNIVEVLALDVHEGIPYIAMEYVRGRSLKEILDEIQRGPQTLSARSPITIHGSIDPTEPKTAARVMEAVALGLQYCHGRGIIHRDIKPGNLLIDENGTPRIVDFGLARDVDLELLSSTGDFAGTPHYMSPEQAMALGHKIDHRTDIYSAGAVLYEMLTQVHPFEGTSPLAVLYSITHDEPRPVRKINAQIPEALATICMKAIEKKPEDRYATAGDLAADLRRFLEGKRILAHSPSQIRVAWNRLVKRPLAMGLIAGIAVCLPLLVIASRHTTLLASNPAQTTHVIADPFLVENPTQEEIRRMNSPEMLELRSDYNEALIDRLPKEPIK